ncbi:hypothetical protein BDY21DRAFT_374019 [Lineolata rhizophorae]|uniref:Uncharacterized protein n=1 Tax=Lineolata rhizophorae TaxID=578093 RepID=A0A6A6NRN2_9PEZI|nr:hypothetical protein BDY21DRAFT_374019 [Lineolata rhizophorae]
MTTSTAALAPPSRLDPFIHALSRVYGPAVLGPSHLDSPPSAWTPPPAAAGHRGRYLWTDAFGVLDLLTLDREAGAAPGPGPGPGSSSPHHRHYYLDLAARVVAAVHETLGRTRDGARRLGGASAAAPLAGGLRIGKEAGEGAAMDADGQYFHYLALWGFALNRVGAAMAGAGRGRDEAARFNGLGVQLMGAVHEWFFVGGSREAGRPRMVWKVAVEGGRVLVPSEGNLDPVDGYVVCRLLRAGARRWAGDEGDVLGKEIGDFEAVMRRKGEQRVSEDPLDLGMGLWAAHWFEGREEWATALVRRAKDKAVRLHRAGYFAQPLRARLAFRDFGAALGIGCVAGSDSGEGDEEAPLRACAADVLAKWRDALEGPLTPGDLRPISDVMYAAALVPGAFKKGYFGPEAVDEE